jgi:kynureninase
MSDPLLAWRPHFPILDHSVYLVSHSLGAMPRTARDRMSEFADTWQTRGIRAWEEGWWQMPVTVGNLVGRLIGAGEGEVTMHQNVSVCTWMVLSCFDWTARRNKLVSEAMNFPTNLYNFHGMRDARLTLVPSEDGITIPTERMLDAIDEETALVYVSHVLFRSSYLQDLRAITEKAHRVGALVCADIYQSAGTVPLNLRELGVDLATGGSVKWLCGGPGNGYLYVRRDLWPQLQPRLTGWAAHRNPFAFADGPIDYADDAFRFQHGTPNIPAMYAGMAGYEIIHDVGVDAIRAKSQRQTQHLLEQALAHGFRVNSPLDPAQRGGVIVIDVPNGAEIVRELSRRDILMDYRPGAGIRLAPHFYTRDEEVDYALDEIRRLAEVTV